MNRRRRQNHPMLILLILIAFLFSSIQPAPAMAAEAVKAEWERGQVTEKIDTFMNASVLTGQNIWNRLTESVTNLFKSDEQIKQEKMEASRLPVNQPPPVQKVTGTGKKVKELPEKRSTFSKTYLLDNGKLQAEISQTPVHYKDAKGKWQKIAPTIEATTEDGFTFKNEKNKFKTYFGKRADQLLKMQMNNLHLQLGVKSQAKDFTTEKSQNTVTYAGLFPDAKVKYTLSPTGVKEEILLDKAPQDPTYSFTLKLSGMEAKQQKDGSIHFTEKKTGKTAFTLPAPYMTDSQDDPGSPYGKVYSHKVTQTLKQTGSQFTITIRADKTWLTDPKRKYPVSIDPTFIIQPYNNPMNDAMIMNGEDSGNTFYNNLRLPVGTTDTQIARSLLRFDVSTIPNVDIDLARLQLYYDQYFETNANDVVIDLYRVTQDWSTTDVSWDYKDVSAGTRWVTTGGGGDKAGQKEKSDLVVDNSDPDVGMTGTWSYSTTGGTNGNFHWARPHLYGGTYPLSKFTWIPSIPEDATYELLTTYYSQDGYAKDAPYTITHAGGTFNKTVDQSVPAPAGYQLGYFTFAPGQNHNVVLSNQKPDGSSPTSSVIADSVILRRHATATKYANQLHRSHSFTITDLVQGWIDPNDTILNQGVLLKARDETLGRGGPRYISSENYDENEVRPKLVVVYDEPGVKLNEPTKVYGTGAELTWAPYTGDDFQEYQIHRSPGTDQNFFPSESTLVAPITDQSQTTFRDTTAIPAPASQTNPDGDPYYYQVAVKKKDGTILPSNTILTRLPKAGLVKEIIQSNTTDATLSSNTPTTAHGSQETLIAGVEANGAKHHAIVKFDEAWINAIPDDRNLVEASLQLWSTMVNNGESISANAGAFDAYELVETFDESTVTWNKTSATGSDWIVAGGSTAGSPTATNKEGTIGNDPEWIEWDTTPLVNHWIKGTKANRGFLIKRQNEAAADAKVTFLSQQASKLELRPKLVVYYTDAPSETFYAPDTPKEMEDDTSYPVDVTITNTTSTTWTTGQALSYEWTYPDGTVVTDVAAPAESSFGTIVPGQVKTVTIPVRTPRSGAQQGNGHQGYTLNWKIVDVGATSAATSTVDGKPPKMPQQVAVKNKERKSNGLGLEQFYQYTGKNTGAGSSALVNLENGNSLFSYDVFSNPSRGLASFLRLSYNSMDTSDSVLGYGWSLSATSIMRLGTPLDIQPKTLLDDNDTTQAGNIILTDGDGTTHKFVWNTTTKVFDAPPGVNLYLKLNQGQTNPRENVPRKWVMIKPDRTKFYFDNEGFLTAIQDKNGNELLFTYEERKSNNKPTKFLRYITDEANRQTITINYWQKGDNYTYPDNTVENPLTNPHVIDRVKEIKDISGRTLTFTYSDKGLLERVIDGVGATNSKGEDSEKKFIFIYDSTQGNKNTKMTSIQDPRGNTTTLDYYTPTESPENKWKVEKLKDRLNGDTNFTYALNEATPDIPDDILTTVTDAKTHQTKYVIDNLGRPVSITNAKNEQTQLKWDKDNNVIEMIEANGAKTTWTYDNNGLPQTITDAENNAKATDKKSTVLEYDYFEMDNNSQYHVADLKKKTSPEGRAYSFTYDPYGNLTKVTDPKGTATATVDDYTTFYTYHGTTGLLKTVTDANNHTTTYGDPAAADYGYDANGYPMVIKDAKNNETTYQYDSRGNVQEITDAKSKTSTYTYDVFGRLLTSKIPKDQAAEKYIETPAPVYDANDNVTEATAPNGAVTTNTYDAADQLIAAYAPKDSDTSAERKTTFEYDLVGNLKKQTEPNGNITTSDPNDFVTSYTYDEVNQVISVTDSKGNETAFAYDNVGNRVKVTEPKGTKTTVDPDDYVTTYTYDKNHRVTKVTDAAGKFVQTTYDNDGNPLTVTDKEGNTTTTTYDERGMVKEVKVPHQTGVDHITKYEYDPVGNQIKVITPRGVETTTEGDFTHEKVYDELNRVKEVIYPRDPASENPRYTATHKMIYEYDEVGNVTKVSAPPSEGQTRRNDTITEYFDNGWVKKSSDMWGISTVYDYNDIGKQISRTISGAGGTTPRTMSWDYFPDGKLKARSDTGSPAGSQAVVVDNVETQDISTVGTWATSTSGSGYEGDNHQYNAAGTGADTFTWNIAIPEAGAYNVYVKYVQGDNRITDAEYTITHKDGTATVTKNQQQNGGTWILLGKYNFDQSGSVKLSDKTVAHSGQTGFVVSADAVKVEKDLTGSPDNENKDFTYTYDVNGNMTSMTDNSPHAGIKTYAMTYSVLNQVDKVEEKDAAGAVKRTINFAYDENGNSIKRAYNEGIEEFEYDIRNLLTKVIHKKSETDTDPKVTTYQYNNNGQTSQELLPNNNLTTYTYNLDGSLKEQITKKDGGNGAIVNRHTLEYNANGHRTKDTLSLVDAKGNNVGSILTYTYDPMDRIAGYTKTGDNARTETYVHDANNNVIEQTIDGTTTTYTYDRNRLVSVATGGSTAKYNYDVYGRLRSVTSAGTLIEQILYDGFDHVKEHKALKEGSTTEYNTTQYAYDPIDRTTQKVSKVGTPDSKTTDFAYLGLSKEVLLELENAQVVKSYQYAPTGKRLAMINHKETGDQTSYYGYNPHTDVEMLYKPDGSVEGTYGYTAYGKEDKAATTGVDDPDPADNPDPNYDPDDPVNDYRYSAKRWDPSTKSYDMGFRDYSPGLNRFTTLDMYNGALQDMGLSTSPWTNNRYGFAGGNPISNIEWDGHVPLADGVYQTAPVSDYNRAISVGENLYGTSIKKDAGYDTRRVYEAWSNSALKSGSTERQIASFATGFTPGVGEVQDLTILFAGYDPVSGEEISNWYGLALFLPFVGGGTLRGAVKGVDEIGEGFEVLSRRWSNGGAKGAITLTRAHKRNLKTLDNIVENHLTDMDFSGTIRDLQGNPVPKPGGGYWNHLKEMEASLAGLQKIKRGLEGSLRNPNLNAVTKQVLQEGLDKANLYITKITDLFDQFNHPY